MIAPPLSPRAFQSHSSADSWEEVWEAGPYYERLSAMLEEARSFAVFVGWQIDSRLTLPGPIPGTRETLKQKILRTCLEKPDFHFYFLIWDHAYFYVLEREQWQGRVWENLHPQVHFIFDNRHPFGGAHHEKICLFDGKVALCGGIDICSDRWDSPAHLYSDQRRSFNWQEEKHGPYHDLAVQVSGPICREIQEHVAKRWRTTSSIPFPDPVQLTPSSFYQHSVYLSRTVSSVDPGTGGPPLVREIEFLFRNLIQRAEHRIILEGQYYWSREINDLLIGKIHQMKGRDFEVVLVLAELSRIHSLTKLMANYELSLLGLLQSAADRAGVRLTMGSPYVYPPEQCLNLPPKPVYIHSKLVVIDDRYLSVGSANFAARAMRIDTEVGLTLEARNATERAHVQRVGDEVLNHWHISPRVRTHTENVTGHSDIRLRPFLTRLELAHQGGISWIKRPWKTNIPYQSVTSGKAGGLERREPPKAVELLEPAKRAGAYLNSPS